MFRDEWEVFQALGTRESPGGVLTVPRATYYIHAGTDDGVTHMAELTIDGLEAWTLNFPCRRLIIDSRVNVLPHPRGNDAVVDCMTCLVGRS